MKSHIIKCRRCKQPKKDSKLPSRWVCFPYSGGYCPECAPGRIIEYVKAGEDVRVGIRISLEDYDVS